MSWIDKLYQTYNNCISGVENVNGEEAQLLPVCHTTQNAQIKVYIDGDGCFNRAEAIPKHKSGTLIPCTEKSGGRAGSKPVNHPLCDKLQYLAGDFTDYGGTVTSGYQSNPSVPHEKYMKDLSNWCSSLYKHTKVEAVFNYLNKRTLISDLVKSGVLFKGEDGRLINKWDGEDEKDKPIIFKLLPGGTTPKGARKQWQADAFIIFAVEKTGDPQSNLYEDSSVWNSWTEYYKSLKADKGFCFIKGSTEFLTNQHPAKIRNTGDKAKLISANDKSGFTYRGRFTDDREACTIGFDVSQKAHNALRWLIQKQGFRDGDLAFVAWAVSGVDIPDPFADTDATFGINTDKTDKTDNSTDIFTAENIGISLAQRISGYSSKLGPTDQVIIMGVDSATTGRLAVIYYRELTGSDFLARVQEWHKECAWYQRYSKDKRFIGAPSPRDIAKAAYGAKVDEKLKKAAIKRILPCIIDSLPIPIDIVINTVRQACNRHGLKAWEWSKTLGIACSLYKYNYKERGYKMALERDRKTRDYLYGRLLAVADSLEGFALSSAEKGRPTNAARLMQRFANYPCSTWRNIELALSPYKARLGAKIKKYDLAQKEIMDMFVAEEFSKDEPLGGEFLLGYHTQRSELMKAKIKTDNTANEKEAV